MTDTVARPTLRTERLVLDAPTENDLAAIVDGVGDIEVARWLGRVPHPYGLEDAAVFLREVVPHAAVYAIRRRDDPLLLGTIGLHPQREPGKAETMLGYWLARPAWGYGYATEAGRAVVAFAFGALGMPRLVSGYFEGNAASARVLDKLGFRVVGRSTRQSLALGRDVVHIDMVCERPGG